LDFVIESLRNLMELARELLIDRLLLSFLFIGQLIFLLANQLFFLFKKLLPDLLLNFIFFLFFFANLLLFRFREILHHFLKLHVNYNLIFINNFCFWVILFVNFDNLFRKIHRLIQISFWELRHKIFNLTQWGFVIV
jgi:hypothetical protein